MAISRLIYIAPANGIDFRSIGHHPLLRSTTANSHQVAKPRNILRCMEKFGTEDPYCVVNKQMVLSFNLKSCYAGWETRHV